MAGPFTVPAQQGKSTEYGQHLRFDGVGQYAGAAGIAEGNSADGAGGYLENIQGHRSGVTSSTPWVNASWGPAGNGRPTQTPQGFSNGTGAGTTYAATSLIDTGLAAGVGDANVGGTVTYGANTVTDTARATQWVVGNTAQYAGAVIVTATGKLGIVASAAANVLTLTSNWIGGTPAAGEAYRINPNTSLVGKQVTSVAAGVRTIAAITTHITNQVFFTAWSNGTPANGTPYTIGPADVPGSHAVPPPAGIWVNGAFVPRGGGEFADNAYKALAEENNTEVV